MRKTLVFVYRDSIGDCTNHGVTSRHNQMTFFWECTQEQALEYCKEHSIDPDSALILVRRELWGEDHSYAAPLIRPANKLGPMFGGNFIYTSDDNFYKMCGLTTASPIAVHDRFETQAEYDALSI